MYGVVLMMAMSGSAETPELFHRCCGWRACHGCCGCCGGCYGGCYGCYGCYGCSGYSSCYGCSGCYGCYGCYGGVIVTPPVVPTPPMPMPTPTRAPATIEVSVPDQTVLYFDGVKINPTSDNRRFSTPPLEPGKSYFYTVKAEANREGETVSTTQRIVVQAGQRSQLVVDFTTTGSLVARQD